MANHINQLGFLWRRFSKLPGKQDVAANLHSCIVALTKEHQAPEGLVFKGVKDARQRWLDEQVDEGMGDVHFRIQRATYQRAEPIIIALDKCIPHPAVAPTLPILNVHADVFKPVASLPHVEVDFDSAVFQVEPEDLRHVVASAPAITSADVDDEGGVAQMKNKKGDELESRAVASDDARTILSEYASFVTWAFDALGDVGTSSTSAREHATCTTRPLMCLPDTMTLATQTAGIVVSYEELQLCIKATSDETAKRTAQETSDSFSPIIKDLISQLVEKDNEIASLRREISSRVVPDEALADWMDDGMSSDS